MDTKKTEKALNRLLHRNYDAEKGYQQVMDKVSDPDMQAFFKNNAEERYRFGHEIKGMMGEMDMKPDKGSTIEADAHRAWINIKEMVAGNDEKAILEEAKRGEEYAIEDYEKAVENERLTPEHRRLLSDHLTSIRNSKEQLNKLETLVK